MFYLHFIWFQARIVRRRRGQVDVWFITRLRLRTSVPPVPPLRLRLCPRPHVHQCTDRVVAAVVVRWSVPGVMVVRTVPVVVAADQQRPVDF